MEISSSNLISRTQYDIPSAGQLWDIRAYRFTKQPFDIITFHGPFRDTLADHKTNTQSSNVVWYPCKDKQPGRHAPSLLPYPLKLTTFMQA